MFEMIRNRKEDLKKKKIFLRVIPEFHQRSEILSCEYTNLSRQFSSTQLLSFAKVTSYVAGSTYDRLHHAYSYVTIEYLPPMNDQICSLLTCQRLTRSICRISWCNFWRRASMYIQIGQLSSRRRANILD